jgi:hypothetical protein
MSMSREREMNGKKGMGLKMIIMQARHLREQDGTTMGHGVRTMQKCIGQTDRVKTKDE